MGKSLMIQGTTSDAGKSFLVAALCRIFARRGVDVFPFKSQNMALNSFATADGHEIGRAQAVQAAASYKEPSVLMNPVLLKPQSHGESQVVLMGRPWKVLKAGDYYAAKTVLWNEVSSVIDQISSAHDLLIAEGAGSPAEINLKQDEIVNMRVAAYLDAPVLLAADIDRGGVFASLYGTVKLLDPSEQERIKGFLINKFRGDQSLLNPGLDMLADLTDGRPTLGVIPYMKDIVLAREDSVYLQDNRSFGEGGTDIAVIMLPHISNYDDFDPFQMEEGIRLRFVERPGELGNPAAVIIPGTKMTVEDLKWMHKTGFAALVRRLAENGTAVAGICGGYQMLGKVISDPEASEGPAGDYEGMGLLPVKTVFSPEKKTVQFKGKVKTSPGPMSKLQGLPVEGYEIHMGQTITENTGSAFAEDSAGNSDGFVSENGSVWGTYIHGIFDEPEFRRGWLESLGWTATGTGTSLKERRDLELDRIADTVEESIDIKFLERIIGL